MAKLTFNKNEKLKNKKLIEQLFAEGQHVFAYPLKLFYIKIESQVQSISPCLFSVTVPKKKFKKAVDRNRIKRLIREAYRLNKTLLTPTLTQSNISLAIMVIYIAEEELPFAEIEKSIKKLLYKLSKQHSLKEK